MTFDITSPANPRIKRLVSFKDRADRDNEGVFIVEGRRLFDRALAAGLTPLEVYTDLSAPLDWEGEVITVDPRVLDRASYRKTSEAVIAVFPQYRTELEDLRPEDPALLLVVENMEKPGNLGAALRTADAVGADAVITVGGSIDLFNPNALRASTGAVFTVPVVTTGLQELSDWLSQAGVSLLAADPGGELAYWDADLTRPVAILVGAEDQGLSETAKGRATDILRIPMQGSTDSLNASVALAVMAYEVVRQRTV